MITVEELARLSILACEASGADFMLTGALAYNYYAVPRSTKDVYIVVSVPDSRSIGGIIRSLEPDIVFSAQVQFDTITWGRRHIGRPPEDSGLSVPPMVRHPRHHRAPGQGPVRDSPDVTSPMIAQAGFAGSGIELRLGAIR